MAAPTSCSDWSTSWCLPCSCSWCSFRDRRRDMKRLPLALGAVGWPAGGYAVLAAFVHAMLAEYLSFIVLLFALYTVAGGILVSGDIRATPANNAAMLALGAAMASIVGTTG